MSDTLLGTRTSVFRTAYAAMFGRPLDPVSRCARNVLEGSRIVTGYNPDTFAGVPYGQIERIVAVHS